MSLAMSLAVAATASGSWLAIVGVSTFGLEAAEEFGIPLERVVSVEPGRPGRTTEPGTGGRPRRSGVNSRVGTAAAPAASPAALNNGEVWAELVAATFDGFEVLVTKVPQRLNAVLARRVQARMQAREAVLIALGSPGPFSADVELHAGDPHWEGVAAGAGYLRGRRVAVTSSGRRVPRPRRMSLWLPGDDGTVAVAEPDTEVVPLAHQHAG
jgi:hypothetical protein